MRCRRGTHRNKKEGWMKAAYRKEEMRDKTKREIGGRLSNSRVFFWFRRAPVRRYYQSLWEFVTVSTDSNTKKLLHFPQRQTGRRSGAAAKPVAHVWMAPPLFSFSLFYLRPNVGSFTREILKGSMQTDLSNRKRAAKHYGSTVRKDLL